jgi:hypothetical protein
MKFIFLTGGLMGFLAAAMGALSAGCSPNRVLLDGAVGCLACAIVFRWFWSVLQHGFRETYVIRQRAAAVRVTPKNGKP